LNISIQTKRGIFADKKCPLPEPIAMLEQALEYFEQALPNRVGEGRGITLKAIAQTLLNLSNIENKSVDFDRITALCNEAMTFLPKDNYNYQAALVIKASISQLDTFEGNQLNFDWIDTDSPDDIIEFISRILNREPENALQILVNKKDLFINRGNEILRQKRLNQMLLLIPKVYGEVQLETFPTTIEKIEHELKNISKCENWSDEHIFSAFVDLALQTLQCESEELGLQLLKSASNVQLYAKYTEPIAYLYFKLSKYSAVNALNSNNPVEALRLYALALTPSMRLGLNSEAIDLMNRIADIAKTTHVNMGNQIIFSITPIAFEIDQTLGSPGLQIYSEIINNTFSSFNDEISSFILGMLIQLGKGIRFDIMMRKNTKFNWRQDQKTLELHELITQQQRQVENEENKQIKLEGIKKYENDLLLLSGESAQKPLDGSIKFQKLHNLELAFDRYINMQAIKSIQHSNVINPEMVPYLLDNRTVLLDYYFATIGKDDAAIFIIAYTRQTIKAFRNRLIKAKEYVVKIDNTQLIINSMTLRTYSIREALKEESADDIMSETARRCLKNDFEILLGTPTWNYLEELRAKGLDHICIRPHKALCYYPMQLLGKEDVDLADNWTVTFLPSLECLMPKDKKINTITCRVLGLGYSNESYLPLPKLPNAEREVNTIAKIFKTEPFFDKAVTEETVLQALSQSRYVHLCAHGEHNPYAPMFHNLRVTPDDKNDGRICAYEILDMDLKGLEVLSLGSCDSALGRFDAGGNYSGLPAVFFLSGVQTIIGSLWKMDDDAAIHFFLSFYKSLNKGSSKLEAFRHAQLTVRSLYPEARDWATFTYIGDWDREVGELPTNIDTYFKLGDTY